MGCLDADANERTQASKAQLQFVRNYPQMAAELQQMASAMM